MRRQYASIALWLLMGTGITAFPLWAQPPQKALEGPLGMVFCYIPPGEFTMGSPEDEPGRGTDEPLRRVRISTGFYMQQTEVTQNQWQSVMGNNPSRFTDCGGNCPVESVSWENVRLFFTG
jgi:formylglycine-generating enzyme required for sulfatase activity